MKNFFKKIITSILIAESKYILKKYKPSVIAITGSIGKTSTKDAIYTVLSSSFHVRKSDKSFNSEIGVPLTIIGCPNGWNDPFIWISNILQGLELIIFNSIYPKYLVLEIGADHPGDIESISKWLKSEIVVITKVSDIPVHVEHFSSPAEVLKEKSNLIKSLRDNGTLILYGDDKKVIGLAQGVKQNVMTFGIESMASITAANISVIYDNDKLPEGISFRMNYKGNSIPVKLLECIGNQHIYPIIAAATVGIVCNIPISKIVDSFENHHSPKGRMKIIKGINNSIIIDDSYNSSPDALVQGLNTIASLQVSGKRIVAIGDMLDLGNFSGEEHKKIGPIAMRSCDVLVTVGQRMKLAINQGTQSVQVINFDTSFEAGDYIKSIVGFGDIVFVKGSQSMRMERVVVALLPEPEKAIELTVRQEKEWLAKN